MMRCGHVKKLLPVFLDGGLDDPEGRRMQEHLKSCAGCAKELEALRESWAMLSEWKDIEPRPGYVSRFWTRVSQERSWQERFGAWVREHLGGRRLAPAFVAACLVVIVGIFAVRHYYQIQDTTQMLASLEEDEMEMVENMELAENFDLIEEMDFFEDLEIIEDLDTLAT